MLPWETRRLQRVLALLATQDLKFATADHRKLFRKEMDWNFLYVLLIDNVCFVAGRRSFFSALLLSIAVLSPTGCPHICGPDDLQRSKKSGWMIQHSVVSNLKVATPVEVTRSPLWRFVIALEPLSNLEPPLAYVVVHRPSAQ